MAIIIHLWHIYYTHGTRVDHSLNNRTLLEEGLALVNQVRSASTGPTPLSALIYAGTVYQGLLQVTATMSGREVVDE